MFDQHEPDPNSLPTRIDVLATQALELVERSSLDERLKRALKLVAEGRLSYRAIARECGYKSPGSVHGAAQRFGLLTVHEVRRQHLPEVRQVERFRAAQAELQRMDEELWREVSISSTGPRGAT